MAEVLAQRGEEGVAGALDPLALPRGVGLRGHPPPRGEPPEVVEAHDVGQLERAADPAAPPREVLGDVGRPSVHRGAPPLPLVGERVGRRPRHRQRPAGGVQLPELRVRRDLGGVAAHVDGQVAEDLHTPQRAVPTQAAPLPVEDPLHRRPTGRRGGPRRPPCELLDRGLPVQSPGGLPQQGPLELGRATAGPGGDRGDQAVVDQLAHVDEHGVAGHVGGRSRILARIPSAPRPATRAWFTLR